MINESRSIMLSALQHYVYCPRQFALIHIEQVWAENYFTAHGQLLHERVDSYKSEQRGKAKIENWDKIQLCAQALCLEEM